MCVDKQTDKKEVACACAFVQWDLQLEWILTLVTNRSVTIRCFCCERPLLAITEHFYSYLVERKSLGLLYLGR